MARYLLGDLVEDSEATELIAPAFSTRFGLYRREEVDAYVVSTMKRLAELDTQLATEVGKHGTADAEDIFIAARVQAAEIVADARVEARHLVEETRRRCQLALKTAIEKAASAGYALSSEGGVAVVGTDDSMSMPSNDREQQAFDSFFDDEMLDDRSRRWLSAS